MTKQRTYIFTAVKIQLSYFQGCEIQLLFEYALYSINIFLYFITLYIIHDIISLQELISYDEVSSLYFNFNNLQFGVKIYLLFQYIFEQWQDIYCPSLGADFRSHSKSKIATFYPMPCLFFPIKKVKVF